MKDQKLLSKKSLFFLSLLMLTQAALFAQTYTITTNVTPQGAGTVTGGGNNFHYEDEATLTATPNQLYTFNQWQDGNTDNPRNITVTGNATYTANFSINQYTITTNVTPEGAGTVTGGGTYNYNAHIVLTATPNPGYSFLRWNDNSEQNPRQITVTGNDTYTATFSQETYLITTNVSPQGAGSVTGGGAFHYGDTPTLTATANSGYDFLNWNDGNTQNPRQITVTGNATYTTHFAQEAPTEYTITVQAEPEDGGSVEGGGTYPAGATATLTATPNNGYDFQSWHDGNTDNPRQITVTGNATYTAFFNPKQYTITVMADPEEGGTVDGGGTFHYGDFCTVTATENEHFVFIGWTENDEHVSGEMIYRFQVEGDRNLVAKFASEDACIIYVDIMPEGAGTVTGAGVYTPGDPCTLKAMAKPGFIFKNWTLGEEVVSEEATYSFTVEETARYTANFDRKAYSITVQAEPEDGGDVSGGGNYYYDTNVTIGAIAKPGYEFSKWLNDENIFVSSEDTITIRVTSDASYTAIFTQNQLFTINAIANPEEGGTAAVINGPTFVYGANCKLMATANSGYVFSNWTLNDDVIVSIEPTYEFSVTGDATFTANFSPIQQSTITVTADPAEGGSVTGGGNYAMGLICHLNATPNEGYRFVNWTEDDMTQCVTEQYSFTVNSNRSLVAHFAAVNTFIISAMAGANGDITPRGDIIVAQGAEQTFSITPDAGCRINKVLVDGIDVGSVGSYTFTNVNRDHTIYVSFNGVGVDEAQIPSIDVYPNPAKDIVQIEGECLETVSLFDMFGNCLYRIDAKSETKFDVSGLSRGIYILMLTTKDEHIAYQKLVLH